MSVYVTAAELHGRFSGRPERRFQDMVLEASRRAIRSAGLDAEDIDALYAGAMGNFEPEGFVGPVPIRLANTLGLHNADITPMLVGSSEAGAWVLRHAFEAMRRGADYKHVLVVAAEQMNPVAGEAEPTPSQKLAQQMARNQAITEILDDAERAHGLNMLRMGDLTMDAVRIDEGWTENQLREAFLPALALSKYRRVAGYPMGHLHRASRTSLADYRSARRVTRYFNMHDVSPTSSGAVALVLSREPRGDALEILSMSQAYVPLSLAARSGDPRHSRNTRQAFARACRSAGVDLSWLRDADFCLLHDAFASIEYTFLRELDLGFEDAVERALSGWSNPFGGLKTCGHALGASGLLQIAKAFHRIFGDPAYLTPAALASLPDASRCFTTSVGGPLTNVVVTLLQRAGASAPRATSTPLLDAFEARSGRLDQHYDGIRAEIPPGRGLLLASTEIRHTVAFGDTHNPLLATHRQPWIHLVERSLSEATDRPKTYAYSLHPIAPGTLVRLDPVVLEGEHYLRAEPTKERLTLTPRAAPEDCERLAARLVESLEAEAALSSR